MQFLYFLDIYYKREIVYSILYIMNNLCNRDYVYGGRIRKGFSLLKFTRKGDKMRLSENETGRSVVLTEKQMGHTLADF